MRSISAGLRGLQLPTLHARYCKAEAALPSAPLLASPPQLPLPACQVVRELLARHCSEWAGDAEAMDFFERTLRLPRAWLAEARALWAQYRRDDAGAALLNDTATLLPILLCFF